MLDKFKQLNDLRKLRSQALKLQRELAKEEVVVEEEGIKVVMSGDQKVKSVEINGEVQHKLARVLNQAIAKVQYQSAAKMAQMGGGLGGLLGRN